MNRLKINFCVNRLHYVAQLDLSAFTKNLHESVSRHVAKRNRPPLTLPLPSLHDKSHLYVISPPFKK